MEEKLRKYAKLLLNKCLVIENNGLYINIAPDAYEFAYIMYEEALKMGIKNIDLDFKSEKIRAALIENKDINELFDNDYFNKEKLDIYTKNNYAFLFLVSFCETKVDKKYKEKELELDAFSKKSCSLFRKEETNMNISWCIGAAATKEWAKKLFPNDINGYETLWNTILDICYASYDDPERMWDKEIENNINRYTKLNNLNIKTLVYKNSLGTDFKVDISNTTRFLGADEKYRNEKPMIVNMPSFEIFTSPMKYSAEGIVYSSKPLVYNGKIIDKFYLKFEKGKVVDYNAEIGLDTLENILNTDEGAKYLGEVALVDYNSPISKTNICFYETLYDENSSCHLALGDSFESAIKDFNINNDNEYEIKQLNKSITHVDFMIGTNDLEIEAITYNGDTVKIFEDGNFII